MEARAKPATCVVICYWTGFPVRNLYRLLKQMSKVDAGSPFDVVVVTNGGDVKPLKLDRQFDGFDVKVINRVNRGYNIEAWDVGWRSCDDHDYFLFLQSECFLKQKGWIADFEFRMARDRGVGLLGEHYHWEQKTWEFIREATDRDIGARAWPPDEPMHPIDTYRTLIAAKGLPLTDLGTLLSSIILFTSKAILEEVGGFPIFGTSYREAVASEVAFSRIIESRGYRLSRIRDRDFSLIGHHQYTTSHEIAVRLETSARDVLKKLGLKRVRDYVKRLGSKTS